MNDGQRRALLVQIGQLELMLTAARGESARRKIELQNSNKGIARLSAKVQRQKSYIGLLEDEVRVMNPDSPTLPENRRRAVVLRGGHEPHKDHLEPSEGRVAGGMVV